MIGNKLSFISEHGRPYSIAPAYDMTPMAFVSSSGGGLPDTLSEATILGRHYFWQIADGGDCFQIEPRLQCMIVICSSYPINFTFIDIDLIDGSRGGNECLR